MFQIIKLNSQKTLREKELEEGYKLFKERNLNIKNGIKNKIYSSPYLICLPAHRRKEKQIKCIISEITLNGKFI